MGELGGQTALEPEEPPLHHRIQVVDLDLDFVKLLHAYCDRLFDPALLTATQILGPRAPVWSVTPLRLQFSRSC